MGDGNENTRLYYWLLAIK